MLCIGDELSLTLSLFPPHRRAPASLCYLGPSIALLPWRSWRLTLVTYPHSRADETTHRERCVCGVGGGMHIAKNWPRLSGRV